MEQTLTINAAGVNFHVQQIGERPQAIFLHGIDGDLHSWDLVWSELGDDFSALRYDLRGFGQSTDNCNTPFHHADDLAAILNAITIEQIDVIGVSMGGSIALNFALDYPERVRNLILISPGMVAWEWSEAWKVLWQAIVDKARSGDMDAARQLWFEHPLFATTRASHAKHLLYESIQKFSGVLWLYSNEKESLPDVERLYSLKPRTLLLTGQHDFEDFRLVADLIEASAPDVTRIDWPGYGHLLNLENPAGCAREIKFFLNDVPS